jgi:hypothetical protein
MSNVSQQIAYPVAATPARFGGKYFQGECNVNDCVPFWVFSVLVCIQVLSILAHANTVDSDTGLIRSATLLEKIKAVLKTLLLDLIIAAVIFYLCRNCKNDWAWFVLFLPIILMGLLFFVFMSSSSFLKGGERTFVDDSSHTAD